VSKDWIRAEWPAPPNVIAGTTLRDSDYELPAEPHCLTQVHGARVVRWGSADFNAGPPEADAIVADKPGACCAVRTADCLPILLCAADGTEIAAAHGGWRGLVAGVIEATVAAMSAQPEDIMAWFGPAISQPAFEVGTEVRDAFVAITPAAAAAFVQNEGGRWQADLYMLAARSLGVAGVTSIYGGGLCTVADKKRFFSYRRDRDTGRMLSFIFLQNP
jgi:YfiH family protein